ncbi:hypothetical protein AGMMS49942_03720 [Spirochaetia bacterium]|nr:hypothetical protein AGMMS49942_03720 [Spirochaetia bacterium]
MNQFDKTIIGKPEPWLIEAAAEIGFDFTGFRHETTSDFKRHVIKRHGNPAIHGRATITEADFSRIPDIVKKPDNAIVGATRKGRLYIIYAKTEPDMTYIYFEQILDSHRYRVLRGNTFYKVTRPLGMDDIKKIVTWNDKTDISGAVSVNIIEA